jgi:GDP-mannose 6-dehydrogenase
MSLLVYDPEVHLSNLLGANRRFIETHVPHIGALMRRDLEQVIAESELLVVGLNDARTIETLGKHLRDDQIVLDLANVGGRGQLHGTYVGLCW